MNLGNADLNLLVALDALLTERNVTRAAERLSLGQPATSAALQRLRRMFDDPLLVRRGRGMELTPLAQLLVVPVRDVLQGVEGLLAIRPDFNPARDKRSFSVMASDYVTLVLLRPLLARLADVAPNVQLSVIPMSLRFRDVLSRAEADLVLFPVEMDPGLREFPHATLFTDRYVCTVWNQHPEVGDEITLEMFSGLPYLTYTDPEHATSVDAQLDAAGVERKLEVSTGSFVVSPMMLRGTRLVALLHERLALAMRETAELRILEPPLPLKPITELMFWHPRSQDDPAHRWLRKEVAAMAADLPVSM
ncbi:LysR family transcriptional regulator [Streptomyces sp. NPDC002643]